jgi:uncharacterized coiled-coil protein SlyX
MSIGHHPRGLSKIEIMRQDLQNLSSIVTAARGLIAKGQSVNLEPLEREVQRLCDQIIKLPGVENAPLRPMMTALIDELTKLAGEMRGHHAQLQEQLRELTARERATAAYVKPGGGRTPRR